MQAIRNADGGQLFWPKISYFWEFFSGVKNILINPFFRKISTTITVY